MSLKVAKAIKIHYSRDELLNSKKEYNANCLTRIGNRIPEGRLPSRKKPRLELDNNDEFKLGTWLRMAEKRCLRAGKLMNRHEGDDQEDGNIARRLNSGELKHLVEYCVCTRT